MTKTNTFWKYIKSRLPLLLIALCIITCAIASVVYGKYVTDKDNTAGFEVIAQPSLELVVSEPKTDDQDSSKTNYTIANSASSNMPTFIRFTVVVNWVNSEGNLWFSQPVEGTDYVITTSCTELDGYYYYDGEVPAGNSFNLSVSQLNQKDGYTMKIEVVAESVQSVPTTAVEEAWGVTFNGTDWAKK